jgi:nitrite reductase/ring-hydroxylating ferredoxin subunit
MPEVNIGSAAAFPDPGRKVIAVGEVEIGVFKLDGAFLAYLNHCPHMGGPACQGRIIAKVEEVIAADRTSKGLAFSPRRMHVVCPWHGYEFDIRTGRHPGNPRLRLQPLTVRVSGDGDVIVTVPETPATRATP